MLEFCMGNLDRLNGDRYWQGARGRGVEEDQDTGGIGMKTSCLLSGAVIAGLALMVVGAGEVRAADADEALRFDPFALRTVSATTAGRIQRLAATASASRTARVIAACSSSSRWHPAGCSSCWGTATVSIT